MPSNRKEAAQVAPFHLGPAAPPEAVARRPPRSVLLWPERSVLLWPGRRLGADLLHDRRVGERGHVTELALLGDIPQQPPHDLPGAGLWQVGREDDRAGAGQLAD